MGKIKMSFYITGLNRSKTLQIEAHSAIIYDLFTLFRKGIIQKNAEFMAELEGFLDKYANVHKPLFQLRTFFKESINDDDYFCVMQEEPDLDESKVILETLMSLKDAKITPEYIYGIFGETYTNYSIFGYDGTYSAKIGSNISDTLQRTCRFCGEKSPEVTFKDKAHAISDALGNKTIVCLEECDVCNHKFGEGNGIETDFISFFDMDRVIAQIPNKENKIPALEFPEYKLYHNKGNSLSFKLKKNPLGKIEIEDINDFLPKKYNINLQNIYRTLCKYLISTIKNELLPFFNDTISWINGTHISDKLPLVAITNNDHVVKQPSMTYYIRNEENHLLPYCIGEFRFANLIFSFIVPYSSKDSCLFIEKVDFEQYWETMKHYNACKWNFQDYSNDTKEEFFVKFSINLKK